MWRERSVIGLGLVNKDFVARVPAWERDQKTVATAYFEQVGGPVPVALTAMARLGLETPPAFLSVVGADKDGHDLAELLTAEGVDTSLLTRSIDSATSKSLVILDERDGSRTLANWSDGLTSLILRPEQENAVRQSGLLHLDGRDLPVSLHAARIIKEAGGIISIDLGTM